MPIKYVQTLGAVAGIPQQINVITIRLQRPRPIVATLARPQPITVAMTRPQPVVITVDPPITNWHAR